MATKFADSIYVFLFLLHVCYHIIGRMTFTVDRCPRDCD